MIDKKDIINKPVGNEVIPNEVILKKKAKTITLKINSNVIMVAVLIILVVVSIGQAAELGSLKEKIVTGEVQAATTSSSSSSSGTGSTPANLQNLPSMVGGC